MHTNRYMCSSATQPLISQIFQDRLITITKLPKLIHMINGSCSQVGGFKLS
ncbi:hypothetical protein HanXRQr2_Chr09g0384391 [Helianthus annuus]|uniref:Uncharacterized protein n=1 Tax=Helianthus annuus TaxID=4232 RepID=A0A9K3N830_HELAN|nr:hypothetical protein HanXRQr2_Chr09g0384391 [Helianthus annuus]